MFISMMSMGISAKPVCDNARTVDYNQSRIIIDTSASFVVRNFLMNSQELSPIISCGLYNKGRYGFMLSEDKNRSNRLPTIWAHLYFKTLTDKDIRKAIFSSNMHNVLIGQSCSSQTMIVDDARISLMAATMSIKIQKYLEMNLLENAEILFSKYDDDEYSLQTIVYTVPKYIEIKSTIKRDWKVFISETVIKNMKDIMNSKIPNETGGALIGSIFQYPKTVVVTDIIDAPSDSIEAPNFFVLGVEGLKQKIYAVEKQTNGKITYLGTWHSHPYDGKASPIDKKTFKHLQFIRNNEPTICVIINQNEVALV